MSAVVKLSSKMPADVETNGLDQHRDALIADPKNLMCSIVWHDVVKINVDIDTGEQIPVVRVRRIEPLGDADAVSKAIRAEVEAAMEKRTGRTPIPWDVVEITEERFSDTLPEDGDQ